MKLITIIIFRVKSATAGVFLVAVLTRFLLFADMLICYWVSSNTTKQD
jgi:hypothetical protein